MKNHLLKLAVPALLVFGLGYWMWTSEAGAQDATQTLLNPLTASSTILRVVPRNINYGLKIATSSPLWLSALNCSDDGGGGKLTTDSNGFVICGADGGGSGTVSGGTTGFVTTWSAADALTSGTLRDNGTVAGVNATSSTVSFNVQGSGALNPFNVSSSTGGSLLTVLVNGNIGVGTSTPSETFVMPSGNMVLGQVLGTVKLQVNGANSQGIQITSTNDQNASIQFTNPNFRSWSAGMFPEVTTDRSFYIRDSSAALMRLTIDDTGNVGIGTTTPTAARLLIQGSGAVNPFTVSSSTGTTMFSVAVNGSTTIANLTAAACDVKSTTGGSLYCGTDATGGGGGSISTSTTAQIGKLSVWTGLATLGNSILFDNGTVVGMNATSPTISFNIQGTAGGNDILNIASSTGVSVLRVTNNQRVGIGSTTPNATLVVQGTSTSPTLPVFVVASSTSSQLFTVLGNGNVGIGTTTPSGAFVVASGNQELLNVSGTGYTGTTFEVTSSTGTSLLALLGNGLVGVNSSTPIATLAVRGVAGGTAPMSVASSSGSILFQVNVNGSTTISSLGTGNVCTNSGSFYNCTVAGGSLSGGTNGFVTNWTSGTTVGVGKLIDNGTVIGMNATSSTIGFNIQGTAGGNEIFNVASSTGISVLRVTNNQRVSIGSTTPYATLVVQGTSTSPTLDVFRVASSTGEVFLTVLSSGYAGIGTANPLSRFSLAAPGVAPTALSIGIEAVSSTFYGASGGNSFYVAKNGTQESFFGNSGNGYGVAGTMSAHDFIFRTSNTDRFQVVSTGQINMGTTTVTSAQLFVQAAAGNNPLTVASSSGSTLFKINPSGYILTSSVAPTIATSTGIGSSAGIAGLTNHDATSGFVNFNSGATPVANATIVTITFPAAWVTAPNCVLTKATTAPDSIFDVWATTTTTTLLIKSTSTAIPGSSQTAVYYQCFGH